MKYFRSLKNWLMRLAENPNEMCHASWLANIGLFLCGLAGTIAFGWIFIGLFYEYSAVGPNINIIFAMIFAGLMTFFGIFLAIGGVIEIYLKAFRTKA